MEQRRGVDSDVDLRDPGQDREWQRHRFVLPAIALGGMLGASARHAADLLWPTATGEVPWGTWGVNVVGSLLIGVLMVVEAGLMWKYVKAGPPPEDEVLARSDDDAELTFAY